MNQCRVSLQLCTRQGERPGQGMLRQLLKGCGAAQQVPEGVDCLALCKNAMDKYSVEIAGGLGPSAGKVWRVGIMVSVQHPLLLSSGWQVWL